MAEITNTVGDESTHEEVHTGHPTPITYFKVAMILSALTAVEVGVFYIESLGHGIIPILLVLSGMKFALVAMFYMHLKYDSRLFSSFFFGGFVLAITVTIALLGLFKFFITS